MSAMASQITIPSIVYSTVYSGADQGKLQSSASLAFVRGIHRCAVNSSHKWPVTRKILPFDDVIIIELQHTTAKQLVHSHCSDVKWVSRHLNSPASGRLVQEFVQTNIKINIKTPDNWPFVREYTGDGWVPLTKGQWYGKLFHVKSPLCIAWLWSLTCTSSNRHV